MAIPAIAPYPMPTGEELPRNIAPWRVDPRRAVLLIHDMQHYFLRPFPADKSPVTVLVRNVGALKAGCDRHGVPVVYSAQPGGMTPGQRGLLKDFWGPGMSLSAEDRAIPEALAPTERDTVFDKWRASAFFRSGLLDLLRGSGRDQLLLCGVYAHVGILMTACEAFANDIETFVVADAIADFTEEHHRMALDYVASQCAVALTTAQAAAMLEAALPDAGQGAA